jgi:drug/metabolite transporter (DMT)-like permease
MERYFFIGLTLALTAYGQLIVKARALSFFPAAADGDKLRYLVAMLTDAGVLSGLVAAVIASLCWILALERTDIGFAYPFLALSFVIVPVAAFFLFGEPLSPLQLAGLALIIAGVSINALAR